MGEKSDQIERHIEEQRNELGENISELQEKVKSAVDWRAQFQQRPMVMMGIAFGGGMLLSALIGGRSKSSSRNSFDEESWSRNTDRESTPGTFASSPGHFFDSARTTERSKVNETWGNIKGALLGVAATKLRGYVEELVPGFDEHYRKCEADSASSSSFSSVGSSPSASSKTDGHEGWPESGRAYTAHG